MEDQEDTIKDIVHVSGMYQEWFLDYASYVILERAVPHIEDGLKPVQRRILHALKDMDDGRYNKVANVIGQTMKFHPHGDASIGDAMVQIGQKDLLLDTQGNWGNIFTGDKAAAPRYIEVRLSPFSLDVLFNKKITNWNVSYDGRAKEPEHLPVKFPLVLNQGVEGIAVGLSTKILPHNFNELIDASIKILKGIKPKIIPDFVTGGMADFSNYNDGKRGGKVRVRARISQIDKSNLIITELPFSSTTTSLINSIIKANDAGKIKIKKIEDNTAEDVEISITIPNGVSPDKTIDALYRFTDCEITISPIACIINNDKPVFLGVSEILQHSTNHTLDLLRRELEVDLSELQNRWHSSCLERIFIENRIYRKIEDLESWDEIINTIHKGLKPFIKNLIQEVDNDDVNRLTEIKIKRITKFDLNKANSEIEKLEDKIKEVKSNLKNLTDFAIDYFKQLKIKYGKGRERKTEIKTFENIDASKVVAINKKLYVNRSEGFIGTSMRQDEFVCDCSDIDDIIVFKRDGTMKVVKVDTKVFVGKDIIFCNVFKKNDERTIYNMIYKDGGSVNNMIKRFAVKGVTRNKDYSLVKSENGSKVLYFTSNPNGEAEIVTVIHRISKGLKKIKFDINFSEYDIKGRGSNGNIITKKTIKKIELKTQGVSTLAARKIWFDDAVQRLNVDGRGELLGSFEADDKILTITQDGELILKNFDISNHFDDNMIIIEKLNSKKPISIVYFDGHKKCYFAKRFIVEKNLSKKVNLITDHKDSYLELVSTDWLPHIEILFVKEKGKERKIKNIRLDEFISVKGIKATGNKLSNDKIKEINLLEPFEYIEPSSDIDPIDKNQSRIEINNEPEDGQIKLEL